ncbi:MAG: tetratricopeptide repeat protein [Desulfobulbaceae bacterium]|jgi:tetratricopeptide (TPR) repeat protein|nr:tetratricopeptide repeat protein [Desulfobulbaceae bacterium]
MKITIIITLFLLFLPTAGFCQEPILDEANKLFSQGVDTDNQDEALVLLDKALLRYEQLYRDQPAGRLAYNIGNTYYQMNNKPMALVYYKRALKSIPTDQNLKHNLELVREELHLSSLPDPEGVLWLPVSFTANIQYIFLACYGFFWITAAMRYAKKEIMPLGIPLCFLCLTLASSTPIGLEFLQPTAKEGVITLSDTMGRQGNGRSFAPSFQEPLAVGTEFQVREKRGYWLRIQLNQWEECWIPTRSGELV